MKNTGEQKPSMARGLLAKNVRTLRTSLGLSQEELGVAAGFHRTYVSQVERELANVTTDGLDRLASSLNVTVGRLFDQSTSPGPGD